MDHRQSLQPDTVLDGKYRIERILGSGGFGITYEAFDVGLASVVAIKEYFPSQFGIRDATYSVRPRLEGDRDMFERLRASFLREARTLNQFDHPAIVRVLNVFEAYGTAYMVMKYEVGPSLKAWLADLGRLPTQDELDRLAAPLLDALKTMHAAEFLHRDIAPDNIIVRPDGTPVLLDFGASRRVMGEMTGTLTGVVKKGYSPQEQYATDGRSQGPWTDVYALGATLYRCVSNETPDEATDRMLDDRLLSAVEVGAGHYRPAFLAAIDAAMVLRPKDRPQSITAWREMLFEGVVVPSEHPPSWPTAAGIAPTNGSAVSAGQSAAATLVAPRPSGAGGKKAALAAGLVALIGGGALLAGWDPVGSGEMPTQPASQDVSIAEKTDEDWRRDTDEVRRRHEEQIARLTREAAERAADDARRRKLAQEAEERRTAEEARERAAEDARRATEEEKRKRQLAAAIEAQHQAEELHKRAIEEGRQRAAEVERQRKLAEVAQARRLAAEETQRRQEEEIKRLTREAAERATEATRRQIEEEARQRKLAEAAAQRRKAEEAELHRKVEEARLRAADEARSRAAADERAKEAKERTKVAALSKPPDPAPSGNVFDGRWAVSYTALSTVCRSSANRFPLFISDHKVSTRRGATGRITSSGSVRWSGRGRYGRGPVDWRGTFKGNSGSGTYASRHGRCHGRFTARRN